MNLIKYLLNLIVLLFFSISFSQSLSFNYNYKTLDNCSKEDLYSEVSIFYGKKKLNFYSAAGLYKITRLKTSIEVTEMVDYYNPISKKSCAYPLYTDIYFSNGDFKRIKPTPLKISKNEYLKILEKYNKSNKDLVEKKFFLLSSYFSSLNGNTLAEFIFLNNICTCNLDGELLEDYKHIKNIYSSLK
ncbi:hypothetical protein ACT4R9_10455 [Ornithobacterium rhinotracheale]|uniref:hypothetical protein n=1 Tax=Ornithobacterium rhinotracheale TaxID=28251 RepID=UPI003FA4C826